MHLCECPDCLRHIPPKINSCVIIGWPSAAADRVALLGPSTGLTVPGPRAAGQDLRQFLEGPARGAVEVVDAVSAALAGVLPAPPVPITVMVRCCAHASLNRYGG